MLICSISMSTTMMNHNEDQEWLMMVLEVVQDQLRAKSTHYNSSGHRCHQGHSYLWRETYSLSPNLPFHFHSAICYTWSIFQQPMESDQHYKSATPGHLRLHRSHCPRGHLQSDFLELPQIDCKIVIPINQISFSQCHPRWPFSGSTSRPFTFDNNPGRHSAKQISPN